MRVDENEAIKARIDRIRSLIARPDSVAIFEAASLAQSVLYDTVGWSHPITATLQDAVSSADEVRTLGACKGVLVLFDEGALRSPRLSIAREIEDDILSIAEGQAQASELSKDPINKQLQLAIAAFLAGASLEDALRRLCNAHRLNYDPQRTSISKLQAALYQPSKQIEIISQSENKQITTWGDTRNKADHGKFSEITHTEVVTMIMGVRSFIDNHFV